MVVMVAPKTPSLSAADKTATFLGNPTEIEGFIDLAGTESWSSSAISKVQRVPSDDARDPTQGTPCGALGTDSTSCTLFQQRTRRGWIKKMLHSQ